MPGEPAIWGYFRIWFKRARHEWKSVTLARPEFREFSFRSCMRRLAWTKSIIGVLVRRLIWHAIVPIRFRLIRVAQFNVVAAFLRWVQEGNFPVYRPAPLRVPVLHFLCSDETDFPEAESRFGWRTVAQRGMQEHYVAFDHENVFHESNLPGMVHVIQEWAGRSTELATAE